MRLFSTLVFTAILAGCQGQEPAQQSSDSEDIAVEDGAYMVAASTPEQTARNYFRSRFAPEEAFDDQPRRVIGYDDELYRWQHRAEILRTFEIADIDTLGDRAAVYVRYSVGSVVYREGVMLRKVGEQWALTNDRETYFSEYDRRSWARDSVALFDKRLYDWGAESPPIFPERSRDGVGPADDMMMADPADDVDPIIMEEGSSMEGDGEIIDE